MLATAKLSVAGRPSILTDTTVFGTPPRPVANKLIMDFGVSLTSCFILSETLLIFH
jgi:hypothetical protein